MDFTTVAFNSILNYTFCYFNSTSFRINFQTPRTFNSWEINHLTDIINLPPSDKQGM